MLLQQLRDGCRRGDLYSCRGRAIERRGPNECPFQTAAQFEIRQGEINNDRLDHWLVERSPSGNLDESLGSCARRVARREDLLTVTQVDWLICGEGRARAELSDSAAGEHIDNRVAIPAR